MKFGMMTHIGPLHSIDRLKFELLKMQEAGRPPSWTSKDRVIAVSVLSITAKFNGTIWPQLRRIERYSAHWAKSYHISYRPIILADHNRKKPKEKFFTNVILGNSNVLSACNLKIRPHWRFLRKRVTSYYFTYTHTTRQLTYRSVVILIDWFTRLMPRVHFPKPFAV